MLAENEWSSLIAGYAASTGHPARLEPSSSSLKGATSARRTLHIIIIVVNVSTYTNSSLDECNRPHDGLKLRSNVRSNGRDPNPLPSDTIVLDINRRVPPSQHVSNGFCFRSLMFKFATKGRENDQMTREGHKSNRRAAHKNRRVSIRLDQSV